jgi:hypothetical protein
MIGLLRRSLPLLAVAALVVAAPSARACPFCSMSGQTLTGQVNQATLVLYGSLTNAKDTSKDGDMSEGTTDLVIDSVIKPDPIVNGLKVVTIPRYVPPPAEGKWKYVVFCDVFKGKIDYYAGMAVKADSNLDAYLKGALCFKDEKSGKRLRFFFDYLDNDDPEISNDAYKEFGNADYKDYKDMAADLPADKIAGWLGPKAKTAPFRYGLYASMLGHCGKKDPDKYAAVLRKLLDDPDRRGGTGMDGVMAGYTLLKPEEGWKYTVNILKDSKKDFMYRYAALRAVRFLHDSRTDVIDRKRLVEGVAQLLDQGDIADLAVEDLRKWRCWDMADKVLALRGTKAYETPIVRRSVLRFALSCKDNKACRDHVAAERAKDAEKVSEAEELLELEKTGK